MLQNSEWLIQPEALHAMAAVSLGTVWALESTLILRVKMEATGIRADREKLETIATDTQKLEQRVTVHLRSRQPDVAHHGNGSAKGDAADSPLTREGDDSAVMPDPEPDPEPAVDISSLHCSLQFAMKPQP